MVRNRMEMPHPTADIILKAVTWEEGVLPGLIKTAKFVVWSYSQIVEFSLLFINLDPIVDQAPFGVFGTLKSQNTQTALDFLGVKCCNYTNNGVFSLFGVGSMEKSTTTELTS